MNETERENNQELPSIGAAVKGLYASISFEEGDGPDIGLLRSLFHPEGTLIRMTPGGPSIMRLETFVSLFREQIDSGFFSSFVEEEIASRTETFGSIAHVFSTYEARFKTGEETQATRGINSIQLFKENGRWRVVSIMWGDEREGCPIPQGYLP